MSAMFEHDNEERQARRTFTRRAILMGGAQLLGFSAVAWRLFQLQVLDEGRYDPLADENRTSLQVLIPKRGRIVDRNGVVLADNEETFRVTLTPALAGDVRGVLDRFRRFVPLQQDEVEQIAKRAKRQSRNTPITIASDITFDLLARINLYAPQLPGIRTEVAWRRRCRAGMAAGHVVGYVGSVERLSIDDDALTRMPDVRIGKTGVEAGLEQELRGDGGVQKIEVDARGRMMRRLEVRDPVPGRDVRLTIDTNLQRVVFERLRNERRGACVVLDVKGGEIVAMASTPSYDPALVTDAADDVAWRQLVADKEKPLLNRAIGGQYPPGSTFKMATALAGLHMGAIRSDDKVTCRGYFDLADHRYRCWKRGGHGSVSMHEALRESCDVYFFELARRLGIDAIADMARMLGLGEVYNCGLPQQKAGLVADPDWKRGKLNAGWLAGETVLAGIGQGYMLANPLQLAVMASRLATGRFVEPSIIKYSDNPRAGDFPLLGLDEAKLKAVRDGLHAVVNEEGGTGRNAALGEGRPLVAGKTGTSQIHSHSANAPQDDLPWEKRDHALFVGYVPADDPRYAIAVVIEHGGAGGSVAAPLARDVLDSVLQIDPAGSLPGGGAQGRDVDHQDPDQG
ncbi:MAG: penicillin-binding protein 2 [Hyphomicrobiaceae bacterium]